jgi:transposase-like protein
VIVVEYTEAFRAKMVRKMLPPGAVSAIALAAETGMNQSTLSRWLKEARTEGVMDKASKKWTTLEKLRVVVEASRLSDSDLGEFLRREGLHEAQLKEWREAAEAMFAGTTRSKKKSPEAKRIKQLERELHRNEKALAEAAAILVLKKKAQALGLLGDEDDDTTEGNEP